MKNISIFVALPTVAAILLSIGCGVSKSEHEKTLTELEKAVTEHKKTVAELEKTVATLEKTVAGQQRMDERQRDMIYRIVEILESVPGVYTNTGLGALLGGDSGALEGQPIGGGPYNSKSVPKKTPPTIK